VSQEGAGAGEFELSGGALCLDFVNTLGDRPRCRHERLRAYDDLLRWAAAAGLLDARALQRQRREAVRLPRQARAVLSRALRLREALYRVFAAGVRGERAGADDLGVVNDALRRALPRQRLAPRGQALGWHWDWDDTAALEFPLWPVARAAADLLVSHEAVRVHECASDVCSWLFVDRSPGARRRWCDMKSCGNRAKARRFYQRRRVRAPGGRADSPPPASVAARRAARR
jgi:predicted RNA-binding Zn ribbon-like protein